MSFEIEKHAAKDSTVRSRWFHVEPSRIDTFEMELCFISRKALDMMAKNATRYVYNDKLKARAPEINTRQLFNEYAEHVVKDWRGLTVGKLRNLMVLELPDNVDLGIPVEFSKDNLIELLLASRHLDSWITDIVTDPSMFVEDAEQEESEIKNS